MATKSRPTAAEFVTAKIQETGRSQAEIAAACGWEARNMVTMVKQGRTRLPLDKVGPLAAMLDVDANYLFWLVLQEYYPDTLRAIEDSIHGVMLNAHERTIIETYRDLTHGQDHDVELTVNGDVGRVSTKGAKVLFRRIPR